MGAWPLAPTLIESYSVGGPAGPTVGPEDAHCGKEGTDQGGNEKTER